MRLYSRRRGVRTSRRMLTYYSKEKQALYGVVGIELKRI